MQLENTRAAVAGSVGPEGCGRDRGLLVLVLVLALEDNIACVMLAAV